MPLRKSMRRNLASTLSKCDYLLQNIFLDKKNRRVHKICNIIILLLSLEQLKSVRLVSCRLLPECEENAW